MVAPGRSGARRSVALGVVIASVVAAVAADPAAAQPAAPPLGFSDGHWSGSVHWQATLTGEGVAATGLSAGTFEVQWAAGIPTGALLATGSGASTVDGGGSATLAVELSASFTGTADQPLLRGDSLRLTGTATAAGMAVPVDLTLGAGDLGTMPLDVRAASCTTISGDFESAIAAANVELAGVGSISAPLAMWSAVRTGDGAALDTAQLDTLNQMLATGDAMEQAVHAGTFDHEALFDLLLAAQQFSYSIARGEDCGYPAGTYGHAVSGMVARILEAMIANAGAFDHWDWQIVVLAAAASGLLGPGSGVTGAAYLAQLVPIVQASIDLAFAAADKAGLLVLMMTAHTMGAGDLVADASDKYDQLP